MNNADDDIVPSSGFVMDAVRCEASIPPPIPFPWRWALPGLAAFVFVLAWFVIALLNAPPAAAASAGLLNGANQLGVGWMALALLTALASVVLSMRFFRAKN
jgi:hypothetical protein